MIGMLENIGRASTSCLSKLAPEVIVVVSMTGAFALTTTVSVICTTSNVKESVTCCATANVDARTRHGLVPHLDQNGVAARLDEWRLEIPLPVGLQRHR